MSFSFFTTTGLLLLLALGPGPEIPAEKRAPKAPPPNILLVIADDWSFPHAGIYGDPVVKTPHFDRIAREGVLFTNAYCATPSCTPSRAALLTGQYPHRLQEGASLHGFLPRKFPNYTSLLDSAGYAVGMERKGWGPGNHEAGGYAHNPAGKAYPSFREFFASVPAGKPFCFWFGSQDPHRAYEKGTGQKSGMDPAKVRVPGWLPDTPEVRRDILDYYFEIERLDRDLGDMLQILENAGQLDNTLIVVTSDNGMPFPRAKANLYDSGTRMPLAIRWKGKIPGKRVVDAFVNLVDLAPTFLEAAGRQVPKDMSGASLLPLLTGKGKYEERKMVFTERERHAYVRKDNLGYPSRAVRTEDFLYIRNFRPDRWPGGDPEHVFSVGTFGDTDASPTKEVVLHNRNLRPNPPEGGNETPTRSFFELAYGKRPATELYDLAADPFQLNNLAQDPKYSKKLKELDRALTGWMTQTDDPRATSDDDRWDQYPYYGSPVPAPVR